MIDHIIQDLMFQCVVDVFIVKNMYQETTGILDT